MKSAARLTHKGWVNSRTSEGVVHNHVFVTFAVGSLRRACVHVKAAVPWAFAYWKINAILDGVVGFIEIMESKAVYVVLTEQNLIELIDGVEDFAS